MRGKAIWNIGNEIIVKDDVKAYRSFNIKMTVNPEALL